MEETKPTHLVAHLHFFQTHKAKQKMQKSYQATARGQCKLDTTDLRPKRSPAGNKGYTTMRGAVLRMTVLCKVEHLCFVLKFGGNNPALRVAPKRRRVCQWQTTQY